MRTRAFCRRLEELGLLVPMQVCVTGEGVQLSLGGFSVVDRSRLKALPADRLVELVASEELELVYLHLQSLRNFDALRRRLPPAAAPQEATPAMAADLPDARVTLH